MDNFIIYSERLKLEDNEEILICYENQSMILTPQHIIQKVGNNGLKINDKTFIDCDYVYFMKRRPTLEKRVKENVQKEIQA
jgi:hypothetical protein